MSIRDKQSAIIRDFTELSDPFSQYAYLLELAGQLPLIDSEKRTKKKLIEGCQSRVWLDITFPGGKAVFQADSDTLIIKGVLKLLSDVFTGEAPADIVSADIIFLKETAIMDTFDDARQKGMSYVIGKIKKISTSYC